MNMQIKTRDFKPTYDILKAFKDLGIENMTFRPTVDGLRVKHASRDMVAFLDVMFKASNFDVFETTGETTTFNLPKFLGFTFSKKDKISIIDDEKILHLSAEGDTMTTLDLDILDNPTEADVPIESIKKNCSRIVFDFKAFKTMLKNYIKEDSVEFELTEDRFKIETAIGQKTNVFKGTDIIKDMEGKATSKYSMEYLKLITKLDSKIFTNIKLEFKNDFPLVLTLENDSIKFEFIIAPRVCE
jgi:hypothetical protein